MKKGWKYKKIGEVATILNGGTPKTTIKEYWGGDINWITPKDLGKLEDKYVYNTPRKLTDLGLAKSSAKLFPENSIILSTRAPIGHLAINKKPMSTNQGCRGILPKETIDVHYLFFFLKCNVEILNDLGTGTTFKELSSKNLASVKIPIPPLSEQKQIVAILEEAFAAIDQAKANIEKNIENAEELFQSKLNEIFSQKGEKWVENRLKEVTTKIGSGATPRGGQSSYKESGISLIRSMNVYDSGFVSNKLAFIDTMQAEKLNNVKVKENDVLLNITGASVARCCIAPKECLPARVNQHVTIIRPVKDKLDSGFLHYALISKINKDKLLGIGEQGSTRQAITKNQIENFIIVHPPSTTRQRQLVRELDLIRENTNKLSSVYKCKLRGLEKLKKSILQKAFTGELT